MGNRRDRRKIVEIPENAGSHNNPILSSQAVAHFQSFMLLRDAALCEASARSSELTSSRFVPAAIIMLHAAFDAFINGRLGLVLAMLKKPDPPNEQLLVRLIRASLSSTSEKALHVSMLHPLKRPFSVNVIEDVNLICDVRDVLFHTEPAFMRAHEFPAPIERVCRRVGVEFRRNQSWKHHAEHFRILEWAYSVMIAFFKEWELTTGGVNDLEDSMAGKRMEYRNVDTGEISYGWSMEEMWQRHRKDLYPKFTQLIHQEK